jgi:periplasmic copper chaperone A
MACKGVLLGLWIAATAAAATAAAAMAAAATPAATITVSDAWVRWLPANLPAGGYVTLKNTGTRVQVLTGATSPDYAEVSLHQSVQRDGVSQMQPVSRVEIPPGGALSLAGGGYHLMLEQPTRPLKPGDQVSITLHFAGGSATTARFEVRSPSGSQ